MPRARNTAMIKREKHGISEAKKAPFKVALGTAPFWLRRCPSISPRILDFFPDVTTSIRAQATLSRWRETQLTSRADASLGLPTLNEDAGAARLNCYAALESLCMNSC